MPKIIDFAGTTIRDGVLWRTCPACDRLAAMAPDALFCDTCVTEPPPRPEGAVAVKTHPHAVAILAGPGIQAARHVDTSIPYDAVRVAAWSRSPPQPRRWPAPSLSCAG